ncbi:MAG: mechanosensitive ion channel [Deltaproteobacteria bacterium]|nr:mechanosensitive ion channel [Deltaproteobacteria bacterium]
MSLIIENIKILTWLFAALATGIIFHTVIRKIAAVVGRRKKRILWDSIIRHESGPSRLIIPLLCVIPVLKYLPGDNSTVDLIRHLSTILLISSFGWLFIRLTNIAEDIIFNRFKIHDTDNLAARGVQTQFKIFKKIVIVVLVIITVATILMTFEKIRYLGTSILASAGLAGIIIGLAAQRLLGTILAGVQIAITQPLRIDDVVIVENEWGRIEEINLTYIVVRIWDLRRLVIPASYFIEKPFQNWTRTTADILGTVFIYTDYTIPVSELRNKLKEILKDSEYWDGKTWGLQVTDASEKTIELRALMSAENASDAWNLRCYVREKMIDYIKENYPESLPMLRTDFKEMKINE